MQEQNGYTMVCSITWMLVEIPNQLLGMESCNLNVSSGKTCQSKGQYRDIAQLDRNDSVDVLHQHVEVEQHGVAVLLRQVGKCK